MTEAEKEVEANKLINLIDDMHRKGYFLTADLLFVSKLPSPMCIWISPWPSLGLIKSSGILDVFDDVFMSRFHGDCFFNC